MPTLDHGMHLVFGEEQPPALAAPWEAPGSGWQGVAEEHRDAMHHLLAGIGLTGRRLAAREQPPMA